jgi:hypothetical protein
MAESQIEIKLPADTATEALSFLATVMSGGLPVVDVPVTFHLQGDGTFDAFQSVKELDVRTDSEGQAFLTWWEYPVYRPRRELHSRVTARCDASDCELELQVLMLVSKAV